jgi:hypothetical protein
MQTPAAAREAACQASTCRVKITQLHFSRSSRNSNPLRACATGGPDAVDLTS